MTHRPYPANKDSGVEWLGEVPEHWEVGRLKSGIDSSVNGIWGDEPTGTDDIPCIRVADFDRQRLRVHIDDLTFRNAPKKDTASRLLINGDILLEKSGGGEKTPVGCAVLYSHDIPAICSNFVARLRLAQQCDPTFIVYALSMLYTLRINMRSIKQNTGIQNLDSGQYFEESICFPPLPEQKAISTFLNLETAKIDGLVAEQDRLIELLKEKRHAVISHAVTRGLDPSVPIKDSGVEWLGQIPAHWDVRRIKDVARLESGHTPSKQVPEYWEDCTIPWVSLNDSKHLAQNDYITDTAFMINEAGLANSSARILPAGSVVFTRDATIGLAAITTRPMAVSQHLIAWCPTGHLDSLYLLRIFYAMRKHLDSYSFGATIKTIGMTDIKTLVTAVPPLPEQQAIAAYLDEQIARFDTLMAEARRGIELLKARRTALISAAVTGKIDVREAA